MPRLASSSCSFFRPVAQALLVLLQVAHALVALLAALAVAPGILALLVGLVAQLLLLADHVAELVQRLLHLVVAALAGLRHLQVSPASAGAVRAAAWRLPCRRNATSAPAGRACS
jgi:hypothetical protein